MKKPRWENVFKGQYEEGIFFKAVEIIHYDTSRPKHQTKYLSKSKHEFVRISHRSNGSNEVKQ